MKMNPKDIVLVGAIAISAILIILAISGERRTADAHAFTPGICQRAWENAPEGHKLEARNACRRYVKKHLLYHTCQKPRPLVPKTVRVKGARADNHQRMVITKALNTGRHERASESTQVALIAAGTQESVMRNISGGDGSSVGFLQLISTHGSVRWRRVIENSAGWFVRGAAHHQGLPPGELAQAVQRSGHPGAYRQWVSEARQTYRAYRGPCAR